MKALLSCLLFYFLFGVGFCWGQAGVLDSTFGENGIAKIGITESIGVSGVLESNGEIVALGNYTAFGKVVLARFKTNGLLDSTFGTNGVVASSTQYNPNYLVLQGQNLIVAYEGGTNLSRYNSNGIYDSTFNGNGIVNVYIIGNATAIQLDGKIVEAGATQYIKSPDTLHFAITRYNPDGSNDFAFGDSGEVKTSFGNLNAVAGGIALESDGKIIIGGYAYNNLSLSESYFAIARYDTDGVLDDSFGVGGKILTQFGTLSDSIFDGDFGYSIALQSDGKIVMTGQSDLNTDTTFKTIPVVRFNNNGSLDSSFGNAGKVKTYIPGVPQPYCQGNSIIIERDGKIIVAGQNTDSNSDFIGDAILVRYNTNGTLDTTFGHKGIIIDSLSFAYWKVIMQSDGKIVAVGASNKLGLTVTRYLSGLNTGILNFSVKENPILIYPNPIHSEATLQYTLTQNTNLNLVLYDMQGRLVQTFFTNETRAAGEHSETLCFNANLAAGNYVLRIGNACPNGNSAGRGVGEQGIKILKE